MEFTGPLRLAAFSPPRADSRDSHVRNQIPVSSREAPACVQNAMMNKDKKPFTYTPGGLDLSEIRSEKIAKRLMKNAMSPGVQERPKPPQFTPQSVPNNQTASTANSSAQYCSLPVAVFPCVQIPANPKELLRKTGSAHTREDSVDESVSEKIFVGKDSASNGGSSEKSPENDKLTMGDKINKFSEGKKEIPTETKDEKNTTEKETRLKTFDQFVSEKDPKITETKTNGFVPKAQTTAESDDEEEEEYEEVEEEEEEEEEYSDDVEDEAPITNKKIIKTDVKTIVKNDKVIHTENKTSSKNEQSPQTKVITVETKVVRKDDESISKNEKSSSKVREIVTTETKTNDDETTTPADEITSSDEKVLSTDEEIITTDSKVHDHDEEICADEKPTDEEIIDDDEEANETDNKVTEEKESINDIQKVLPEKTKSTNEEIATDDDIISSGEKISEDNASKEGPDVTEKVADEIITDDQTTKSSDINLKESEKVIENEGISPNSQDGKEEVKHTISSSPTVENEEPIVATLKISPENKILQTITTDISKESPKMFSNTEESKTFDIDTKQFDSVLSDFETNKVTRTSETFMRQTYSRDTTFNRPSSITQSIRSDPMIGRHSFVKSPSEDRRSTEGLKNLNELNSIPSLNMCPKRFSFLRDSPPRTTNEDPFSILTGISPNMSSDTTDFQPMQYQQSNVEVPPPWETENQVPYGINDNKYVAPQKPAARTWKSNYSPYIRSPSSFQTPRQRIEKNDESWRKVLWNNRPDENEFPVDYIAKEDSEPSWRRELKEISTQKKESVVEQEEYKEIEEPPWRREVKELSEVRNQRHRSMPRTDFDSSWQSIEDTQSYKSFGSEVKRAYTPSPSTFVPEIKPTFDARASPYMTDTTPTYYPPASLYTTEVPPPFVSPSNTYTAEVQPSYISPTNMYTAEVQPPFATQTGLYTTEVQPPFASSSNLYTTEVQPPFASPANLYTTEIPPPFASSSSLYTTEVPPPFASPANTYTAEVQPPFASQTSLYTSEVQPPFAESQPSYAPPLPWSQTIRPKSWRERNADLTKEKEAETPEWKKPGILRKSFVNSFKKTTQFASTTQDSYLSSVSNMSTQKMPEITVEIASQPSSNRVAPNNNSTYNYPWETSSESSVAFSPEPFYTERTSTPQSRNSPYRPASQYSAHSYNTSPVVPREYGTLSYLPSRRQEVRSCPVQSRSFKYLQLLTGTEDGYVDDRPFVSQSAHHTYMRPKNY